MGESITFKLTGDPQSVTQDMQIDRLARDIVEAASVLKRCGNELRGWMRAHGTDIDTQNLVNDVDAILKKLKQ